MADRKPLSKKVRFEVFKRDKFTCQYCGAKAPETVLHCDHIKPVAEGGDNDIINLVTACQGCNGGKGARPLDDNSAIAKQQKQLEDLEERRQQLEMLLEWREELSSHAADLVEAVKDAFRAELGCGFNENGARGVKLWLKRFPVAVILSSVTDAANRYAVWSDGKVTDESWAEVFRRIPQFCSSKVKYGDGPEIQRLLYAQGIVRKRVGDKWFKCLDQLKALHDAGYSTDQIEAAAKTVDDEDDFESWVSQWLFTAKRPTE